MTTTYSSSTGRQHIIGHVQNGFVLGVPLVLVHLDVLHQVYLHILAGKAAHRCQESYDLFDLEYPHIMTTVIVSCAGLTDFSDPNLNPVHRLPSVTSDKIQTLPLIGGILYIVEMATALFKACVYLWMVLAGTMGLGKHVSWP